MASKKPKTRQTNQETCCFVIELQTWDFSYSLSAEHNRKLIDEPLWEHEEIHAIGKIISPQKYIDREIEVRILADRLLFRVLSHPEDFRQAEPKSVGSLSIRGKKAEFLTSVPSDAYHSLCSMLAADKIKFIIITGQPLYHGSASIGSVRFEPTYRPEDWQ